MSLQKNHTGCLMPWDRIRPLNTDMPELISIAQSNTVTRHTMIDRKTGTVFSLLGADGKHLVNLTKTTRTVQDVRFKRQLILGISTFGKNNGNQKKKKRNTVLISLTGVIVSTGSPNAESAINSVAATSRIMNTNMYSPDVITCHSNLMTVNAPTCGHFSRKFDLARLQLVAQADSNNIIVYEQDVFPGVRIRNTTIKGAATFFYEGAFLVVGLVDHNDIRALLLLLYPWLKMAMIPE